jgi:hypothetical protein
MYAGQKPEPFEWRTQLSDLYHERDRNYGKAFSHAGVSEMFANADLPQQVRLDSSAGVREARNMEDSRHLRRWMRYEKFRLSVARTMLRVLRTKRGATAFTTYYHPGGSKISAKEIPWEAVKTVLDDQFSWTFEAVPLSMMQPAARRELIRDWVSRNLIDDSEARRMEGNTNLERTEDLELASYDDVHAHLEILEDGDFEAPTELTNLTYGVKRVTQNYHRLKRMEDVEDKVIENHLRWIAKATSIQQDAVNRQQQQAMQDAQAQQATSFAPSQSAPGTSAAPGASAPMHSPMSAPMPTPGGAYRR